MSGRELLFPYMAWAHAESFRSPYSLAQSGMPPPPLSGIAPTDAEVLAWPAVEALPALEARLAELFALPPERVLVTLGATGAMLLAAQRWFGPAAEVAVERPRYEALEALPLLHGARVHALERRLEDGWALDAERAAALARAARGPLHAILTNPHNPSGALLEARTLTAIAAAIEPTGGVLVSNEAYMEFAPPERRLHAAHLAPNAVSIGTLSKAYGLGPLRAGWLLLGAGLADERARLVDRSYLSWIDPPTASLVAARAALDRLGELTAAIARMEARSRPHLARWLRDSESVEATIPPFGLLSFPRVRGVSDTRGLQRFLAAERGVGVAAGEDFGAPGHLRVCCGVPEETLVEGLARLEDGIRAWRGRTGP